MFPMQKRHTGIQEPKKANQHQAEIDQEIRADITTRKAVDAIQDAAAGGKGPQNHQKVGGTDQGYIPDFENTPLLLDDDTV